MSYDLGSCLVHNISYSQHLCAMYGEFILLITKDRRWYVKCIPPWNEYIDIKPYANPYSLRM